MAGNKKCSPLNNNINVNIGPAIPGPPGFGLDLNIPFPSFELPEGIPEDLLAWLERLKFNLPGGGAIQSIIDKLTQTVSKIISDVLGSISYFLGIYMLVMQIIEFVMCIVKVLCGAPNPYSMAKRVKKLLRKCLPTFISICFPWVVFLMLIMALLAILLALIDYIKQLIERMINQLIANIKRISKLLQQGNTNAALTVVAKVGDLLCLFEHIFVLLSSLDLLISIIKGSWNRTFATGCDSSGDNTDADNSIDDVCTEFLRDPEEEVSNDPEIWKSRVKGTSANLYYYNAVSTIFPIAPPLSLLPVSVRNETILLEDNILSDNLCFSNIINGKVTTTSNKSNTFFPFGTVIDASTPPDKTPYTLDMTLTCDPNDGNGQRKIEIKDVKVVYVSREAALTVSGGEPIITTNNKGYLHLSYGQTVDSLGFYNDKTINQLIKDTIGDTNLTNPGITTGTYESFITDYQLKINYDALLHYLLITVSCVPSIKLEQDILDASVGKYTSTALPDYLISDDFPDIQQTISELSNCITIFRSDINDNSILIAQSCMNNSLDKLKTKAESTYCQLAIASIDIHKSTVSIDPDLQFITSPIKVSVVLKTGNGATLNQLIGGNTIPQSCLNTIAENLKGNVSLGKIDKFTYDGYGNFITNITSEEGGDGILKVKFNGEIISPINVATSINENSSIGSGEINYTFVGFGVGSEDGMGEAGRPRRDETDTSKAG